MVEKIGITIIADRYAEAMLDVAESNQCLDFVKNDLGTASATIKENEDLKKFLDHPIIPIKEKKEVVETIFSNRISPYVINLLKLLLDRNRMFIIDAINESFKMLFNKRFDIALAVVTTAIDIDDNTKSTIKQKLVDIMGKHVEIETKVDPEILGGVLITIGDSVLDGSIKGRLNDIKRQLT
ncbi:MAG: ATP synthase F1 subunit delta [Vampirovibrionia bacterium]